jgi:hypothetical protein
MTATHQMATDDKSTAAKLTCPQCGSRLEILETTSGGRSVGVSVLGMSVELSAKALERFQGPDDGPEIICPACSHPIDPSAPYRRLPPLPLSPNGRRGRPDRS